MTESKVFVRSPYNYDRDAVSLQTAVETGEETSVLQSARDEADINVLVKKFGLTGQMPPPGRVPQYGDYDGVSDYQTAMNMVVKAQEDFMAYPAWLRAKFGNDPQNFLAFCSNPENREEMLKLGLLKEDAKGYSMEPDGVNDKEPSDGERYERSYSDAGETLRAAASNADRNGAPARSGADAQRPSGGAGPSRGPDRR